MIDVVSLHAGYRGTEILHGIDLHLQRGKITTVIGPNGCGKTTLLRALSGLLPIGGGEILYAGKPRKQYARREFARLCAFLPQSRDMPSLTVEALVAHGRYPHLAFGRSLTQADREIIQTAMEQADVAELAARSLTELSGGQRQRAYLAMTLAQDTDVLFLDEPTTYLDVGQKYEVMELLKKIKALGKTVILVLHDLPLAFSYSDEVAVLQEGRLLAFGPSEAVFESGAAGAAFGVTCQKAEVGGKPEYFFSYSSQNEK